MNASPVTSQPMLSYAERWTTFREKWVAYRRRVKLSQKRLSEKLCCHVGSIGMIEAPSYMRLPDPGMLVSFSEVVKLAPDEAAEMHVLAARAKGWRV